MNSRPVVEVRVEEDERAVGDCWPLGTGVVEAADLASRPPPTGLVDVDIVNDGAPDGNVGLFGGSILILASEFFRTSRVAFQSLGS